MRKTLSEIAFHVRVKIGYAVAFALLMVSYILTLYNNTQLIKQADFVVNTNIVIINLETLVSGLIDAEAGVRGYVATNDVNYLIPYQNSTAIVDSALAVVKRDTENDKIQQGYATTLSSLIKDQYLKLKTIIAAYENNQQSFSDSLFKSLYAGRIIMERTRSTVKKMQAHEQVILLSRTKELDKKYKALNIIVFTSLIITILIGLFGFITYMREYRARLIADQKAKRSREELQQRILELDKANSDMEVLKRSEKFASTGRIARTIAHEVRNPLTNIDLAVAQIKNELSETDANTLMLFDMVKRNSHRINQLISELLNATRFIELNTSVSSINDLLDEALKLAEDRIELNHIQIEKNYSNDICKIKVDREKIRLAFLNLIVNAIEAMDPYKGKLKLVTRGDGNKCVVELTDNGSGMTEEQLSKVFEPYFTTKASGNGLGLANTANIILNHNGDINVKSSPLVGTTFSIKFDFTDD